MTEAAAMFTDVIPEPHFRRVENLDFVASYANYYVCNGAVIAAEFGDPETDRIAQAALVVRGWGDAQCGRRVYRLLTDLK